MGEAGVSDAGGTAFDDARFVPKGEVVTWHGLCLARSVPKSKPFVLPGFSFLSFLREIKMK